MCAARGERRAQRSWTHVGAQPQTLSLRGEAAREERKCKKSHCEDCVSTEDSFPNNRQDSGKKENCSWTDSALEEKDERQRREPPQVHQQRHAPRPDAALRPISLRLRRWPWCWKPGPLPAHAGHRLSLRTDRKVQRERRGAHQRRRGRLRLAGLQEARLLVWGRQAWRGTRQEVQGAALPAAQHQCPGEEEDARPERRAGRPSRSYPICPQPLGEKTLQNRHSPPGQELHPHAGSSPGRDEAAGGVSEPGTEHNLTHPHRPGALWTSRRLPVLGLRTFHLRREVHDLFRDTVDPVQTLQRQALILFDLSSLLNFYLLSQRPVGLSPTLDIF